MIRFALKIIAFFALQAIILGMMFHFSPPGVRGYHKTLFVKEHRYIGAESRRIVFIGGSNLPFGIRSEIITERTDLNSINLGLSSGLGLNTMLEQLDYLDEQREPQRGDLIVYSLEYQHFEGNHDGEEVLIATFLLKQPQFVRYVSFSQWKKVFDQGVLLLGSGARSSFEKIIGRAPASTIYVNESYNQYGEIYPHIVADNLNGANMWFELNPSNQAIDLTIQKLNAAAERHSARGSEVVFVFPPIPESVFNRHHSAIQRIHSRLEEMAQFRILTPPISYEDDAFYDTPYHLRSVAMERRTVQLIDMLFQTQELAVLPREDERIGMAPLPPPVIPASGP